MRALVKSFLGGGLLLENAKLVCKQVITRPIYMVWFLAAEPAQYGKLTKRRETSHPTARSLC
jgi:hypothetical protein